ncbi:hypothetical protein L083_3145 [Actinoplanes sp. N902-109]|nr:hypothetical protein L083_3145 [Actinoplanes sp. N902-109]
MNSDDSGFCARCAGAARSEPFLGVLVADVVFVLLTVVLFGALTVLVRAVERS